MRVHYREAGPARFRIDTFERCVGFVIGNGDYRGLGFIDQLGHQFGRRRNSIADNENRGPCLEPAYGFLHVADREDADPIQTKSLEGVLERLGYSLNDDDDRSRAGRRGTANLIIDERPSRERKERSEPSFVILLISPDERADRQTSFPSPATALSPL